MMIKHMSGYPTNINIINSPLSCIGFIILTSILVNGIIGLIISLHINIDYYKTYISIQFLLLNTYYSYYIINVHSYITSIIFIYIYLHIIRSIYYIFYYYNNLVWFNGIYIYIILMAICFCGYIIPCGELSIWGLIVISTMIDILSIIRLVLGSIKCKEINNNWSIKRFYIYHIVCYLIIICLIVIHCLYLHCIGSNNMLGMNINNYVYLYPIIILLDVLGINYVILFINCLVISCLGFTSNYNNIEVIELLSAPLHICPEWYFLNLYLILKVSPNKINGWLGIIYFVFIFISVLTYSSYVSNILLVCYINVYSSILINIIIVFNIYIMYCGILLINYIIIVYCRLYILIFMLLVILL